MVNQSDDDNTQSYIPFSNGAMVSHYRMVEKIGSGGMGEVYLAEDTTLKRMVALKFMPSHLATHADMRERFMREARAVAALSHPNIVTIHEVGEFNGRPYFAMEHVVGESLRTTIKQGKLTTDEAVRLTMQICEGLHEAHQTGVVHRDIKPGNIIIDTKGRARILDFGLAMVSGEEKLTKTGSTLGTVGYMSPEQVSGTKVDHRSDLFSVGVILYEMLTGRRPFEGDNDAAIVRAIADSTPEPVARFRSGVTSELQQVVDKALSKDPSLRYQHADGMLADLKRLEVGSGAAGKARRGVWAALAALVVLAGYFVVDQVVLPEPEAEGWTNSVAVLVFRDLSPGKDQDYFCEGMTDEIIGRLSTINNLKVTSMQSMLRFKDTDLSMIEIGKELKVDNILEGNIQRVGEMVRVRAQLIRVEDDAHLWSKRYEREVADLSNIFDIQDDISRAIAGVMEVTLTDAEMTIAHKRGTDNIEAYNAYMRGRYFWRKRTEKDLRAALRYFEEAISLDPSYALAYCGLADAWVHLPMHGNVTEREAYPKAREAVTRALELDENSAESHATMGRILYHMGEWDKAEEEFLTSIELNPGYPWSHLWYATLATLQGRKDVRKKHLDIAFELDPLSLPVLTEISRDYFDEGNLEKMIEISNQRIEIEPSYQSAYIDLAYMYVRLGDTANALETVSRFVDRNPDYWLSHCVLGWNLGTFHMHDKARESFERSVSIAPESWKAHFYYGTYLLEMAGESDEAEPYLQRAMELDSNQYEPYQKYGKLLYRTGRVEQAEKYLKRAVELAPYEANAHIEYGWFLSSALNRHEEAITYFQRVIDLNPYFGQTYNTMAYVYEKAGNLEQTIRAIDKAIEVSPAVDAYIGNRANFLLRAGAFDSALASFERLLDKRGPDDGALQGCATCYTFLGRYREADSIYEYFTAHPDSLQRGWGRYNRIRPLLHQGKFQQALELLREGIEIDKQKIPNSWPLMRKYYHCARIYLDHLNQPETAISFADSAELAHNNLPDPNPSWITTLNGVRAEAKAGQGRFDDAMNVLRNDLLSIDGQDDGRLNSHYESLAIVMRLKGEADSSVALMEMIYTPEADFRIAIGLGRSYLAAGSLNKAIEVLEKAMSRYDDNRVYYPERSAMGHQYLGRAYEAADRTAEAIEQYEIFLDVWKNGDQGLESVEDARARLARLKGDS